MGSLIFAAVLVVVIAVVIQLMMRGWRRRAQRQEELIGNLPEVPDQVGAAITTTRGVYVGSTLAPAGTSGSRPAISGTAARRC